jgi:hypothetical protein
VVQGDNATEPYGFPAPRAAACLVHYLILQNVTSPRFTILNATDPEVDLESPARAVREQAFARPHLAAGEPAIKRPSPLNAHKDTYDHSCYCTFR